MCVVKHQGKPAINRVGKHPCQADNTSVHIQIRNPDGQALPRMEVDTNRLPSILKDPYVPGREIYLDWSGAIDDENHLRKCPACNCQELFVRKDVPQLTAFVLVLVAAAREDARSSVV